MFIDVARYYMIFMAVMVIVGGVIGFVKAKSKASIISGGISGVVLAAIFVLSMTQAKAAILGAFIAYTVLDTIFAMRLKKTGKFMPAGLILILSVIGQALSIKAYMDLPS